jgi:hypothetical protein
MNATFSILPQYAITYVIETLDIDSPVLFIEIKPPYLSWFFPSYRHVEKQKSKYGVGSESYPI